MSPALTRIEQKIDRLTVMFQTLFSKEMAMADALTDLQAQVAKNTAVEESAVTLINGLAAQIKANSTDPVALEALANSLSGSAGDLAAAITANTPASTSTTSSTATTQTAPAGQAATS